MSDNITHFTGKISLVCIKLLKVKKYLTAVNGNYDDGYAYLLDIFSQV